MNQELKDLLQKALKVYSQYGVKSISMDDMARELGISKKNLYSFVANKTELVDKTIGYLGIQNRDVLENVKALELNAIDQLFEYSKYVINLVQNMNPNMRYDMMKYYPEIEKEHWTDRQQFILDAISENYRKGKEEGIYRDDLSIEIVARIYMVKIDEVLKSELLINKKFNSSDIFQVMFENHVRGISSEKGLKHFEKRKNEYQIKD